MRINLNNNDGYRFLPHWTRNNSLVFTTRDGVLFIAHKEQGKIVWNTSDSLQTHEGTYSQLFEHIKTKNNGTLDTFVLFSQLGTASVAHFVSSTRYELFLSDNGDKIEISEDGRTGYFSSITSANRAVALLRTTHPFFQISYTFPDNPNATILRVKDGKHQFFLLFGRTKTRTHPVRNISIPWTHWNVKPLLGVGKPWFILQKQTLYETRTYTIQSERELARATNWDVERIQ